VTAEGGPLVVLGLGDMIEIALARARKVAVTRRRQLEGKNVGVDVGGWVFSDCVAVTLAKLSMCETCPCILRTASHTTHLLNSKSKSRLARRLRRGKRNKNEAVISAIIIVIDAAGGTQRHSY
jgi:hypothetical protein